jgi:hypothetical protein
VSAASRKISSPSLTTIEALNPERNTTPDLGSHRFGNPDERANKEHSAGHFAGIFCPPSTEAEKGARKINARGTQGGASLGCVPLRSAVEKKRGDEKPNGRQEAAGFR